ncbi:tRNA (guanosine-2'-O-)-methyltransferase [Thermoflavifilum aggregans]|uniref:tRNA (guanosine(18)-2'-O)-methyltransferase n=1 Tax=Thermoflavifilum aggregans TaxID=454188 RepID=A0A2M9CUA2_9BACT|nr:RNA methyltransferase [Thermoflavifilum aggregans]MBX6380060.1 RNA methyltransferase [Thermoflavifilum aggregans]PJJ75502.1 tRNA (guanosine-2'-O-)-methyltransferase [Thermoflavifilum aggregans]
MTPERIARIRSVISHRQFDLTVVMENVFDPHNISAVMRSCDAVGVQELYVLNTRIPPHKKWGAKSSASAAQWLTIYTFTDVQTCFAALRKKYQKIYTTHLSSTSASLYDLDLTQSVALVFGNEAEGVSEEVCRYADGNFLIPQVGMVKSLNISVACAVTLYEAFRQRWQAGLYQQSDRFQAQKTALEKLWLQQNEIS